MIKFRAWDKEENEWIVGFKLGFDDENEFWYLGADYSDAIYSVDKLGKTWELMQSTGLKDKNGAEIYVGDIVKGEQWLTTTMPAQIVAQVSYSERNTMFYLGSANESHDRFMHSLGNTIYQYEVIGNIHANPELLNSGIE